MPFTVANRNGELDAMLRATSLTGPSGLYLSLHTDDPGDSGSNEYTAYTGTRPAIAFSAASGGATTSTNQQDFPGMGPATIRWCGLWSTATPGAGDTYSDSYAVVTGGGGTPGGFQAGIPLDTAKTVVQGDTLRFTTGSVDISIAVLQPSAPQPPPPPPPPPIGNLKPPNYGFMLKGRLTTGQGWPVDCLFVNVGWNQLEPSPGNFNGPGWATINTALGLNPRGVRLRLYAGIFAPSWLDNISGPSVFVDLPREGAGSGQVPRFWEDAYWPRYRSFMAEVARRYETNPRVRDVVVSGAMTVNAEPTIRAGDDTASNTRLWNAGLNETTDRAAQRNALDVHADLFPTTRFSFAPHTTWQVIDGTTDHMTLSWPKLRDLLNEFRDRYGKRLVVQNQGPGLAIPASIATTTRQAAGDLWEWLKADNGPLGYQAGFKGDDPTTVVNRCVNLTDCWFFENVGTGWTRSQFDTWQRQMTTNAGV